MATQIIDPHSKNHLFVFFFYKSLPCRLRCKFHSKAHPRFLHAWPIINSCALSESVGPFFVFFLVFSNGNLYPTISNVCQIWLEAGNLSQPRWQNENKSCLSKKREKNYVDCYINLERGIMSHDEFRNCKLLFDYFPRVRTTLRIVPD